MEKTSVGRSTSVDFVPSSSASLRLLGDTWTATAKASTTYIIILYIFFLFSFTTPSHKNQISSGR